MCTLLMEGEGWVRHTPVSAFRDACAVCVWLEQAIHSALFTILERKISMKLFYQHMAIFFNFSPTLSHFYPLQPENCDSDSRLVGNEDDNSKFRLERV